YVTSFCLFARTAAFFVSSVHIVLFSFFSSLPRPPSSTLFPYTTLFRSQDRRRSRQQEALRSALLRQGRGAGHGRTRRRGHALLRDRKSTRLNSSHVSISYAVFCLKKKKESKAGT